MEPTLAVFGAGPALGLSVARRFGRQGYRVALVARDRAKLDRLEAELREDGLTAATATADLADEAQLRSAVAAVTDTFGTPDVVLYAPGDVSRLPVSALELGSEELRTWLPLHLLSPVALIQAVLPGMLERGSGAVLVAQGASAREPMSMLASVGAPQAGLLNYLHALAAEVGPRGVYIGTLLIGALIERSAAAELWDGGHFETVEAGEVPRIEPDELAERYWTMVRDRAQVEQSAP